MLCRFQQVGSYSSHSLSFRFSCSMSFCTNNVSTSDIISASVCIVLDSGVCSGVGVRSGNFRTYSAVMPDCNGFWRHALPHAENICKKLSRMLAASIRGFCRCFPAGFRPLSSRLSAAIHPIIQPAAQMICSRKAARVTKSSVPCEMDCKTGMVMIQYKYIRSHR